MAVGVLTAFTDFKIGEIRGYSHNALKEAVRLLEKAQKAREYIKTRKIAVDTSECYSAYAMFSNAMREMIPAADVNKKIEAFIKILKEIDESNTLPPEEVLFDLKSVFRYIFDLARSSTERAGCF